MFDKYTKRNSSIEILRMMFMAGIVFLHTYYFGADANIEWIYSLGLDDESVYQLSLYSLSRLGVTGFMFVSGYYGIQMNARRLYKLLSMLVFYYVVTSVVSRNGVGIGIVMGAVHAWDSWWFIASYFVICIISPILNEGLARLSKRQFQYVVAGLVIYTYIGHFIIGKDSHDTELLLSIYIIARYLKDYPPILPFLLFSCLLSTAMLISFPVLAMRLTGNVRLTDMLICNNSPLVLVSAASMVMLADRHNQHHGFINWLASSTMAIYLITASGLHQIIEKRLFSDITDNFIHGLFSIALVCAVCLLTDKLRILLFMPLDKKVERWISGKERKSPF